MDSKYGTCECCGGRLYPIWFEETEYDRYNTPTGRTRRAVDCLVCEDCMKEYCVDDSFDGPWR